jgi:hypothetical protein
VTINVLNLKTIAVIEFGFKRSSAGETADRPAAVGLKPARERGGAVR